MKAWLDFKKASYAPFLWKLLEKRLYQKKARGTEGHRKRQRGEGIPQEGSEWRPQDDTGHQAGQKELGVISSRR